MSAAPQIVFLPFCVSMGSSRFQIHAKKMTPLADYHLWDDITFPNGGPMIFMCHVTYSVGSNFLIYRTIAGNDSGTFSFTSDTKPPMFHRLTPSTELGNGMQNRAAIRTLSLPHLSEIQRRNIIHVTIFSFTNSKVGAGSVLDGSDMLNAYYKSADLKNKLQDDLRWVRRIVRANQAATDNRSSAVPQQSPGKNSLNVPRRPYSSSSFPANPLERGARKVPWASPEQTTNSPRESTRRTKPVTPSSDFPRQWDHSSTMPTSKDSHSSRTPVSKKAAAESTTGTNKPKSGQSENNLQLQTSRENPSLSTAQDCLPMGLRNIGNTCFINSVVQALNTIPIFRDAILRCRLDRRGSFESAMRDSRTGVHLIDMLHALRFGNSSNGDLGKCTADLVGTVRVAFGGMQFPSGEQHDAHEFLMYARMQIETALRNAEDARRLRYMASEDAEELRKHGLGASFRGPSGNEFMARRLIRDIFHGQLRKTTLCSGCGGCSTREEEYYDLSLAINEDADGMPADVQDCLQDYFAHANLREGNQYRCETCGRLSDATLLTSVDTFPAVLTLHMVLFKQHLDGSMTKITRNVATPSEIDMSAFADKASDDGYLYGLTAVVGHIGSSSMTGHYVTLAKEPRSGTWFLIDDQNVQPVDETILDGYLSGGEQFNISPYLLFYSRFKNE